MGKDTYLDERNKTSDAFWRRVDEEYLNSFSREQFEVDRLRRRGASDDFIKEAMRVWRRNHHA